MVRVVLVILSVSGLYERQQVPTIRGFIWKNNGQGDGDHKEGIGPAVNNYRRRMRFMDGNRLKDLR